jgi:hypothetical protein
VLPEAPKIPTTIKISFAWTRRRGNRVYLAGHAATNPNGSPAGPFSKEPTEVALEAAPAARSTALAILGGLKREVGDLDRLTAWLMVDGMVNADLGYAQATSDSSPHRTRCGTICDPHVSLRTKVCSYRLERYPLITATLVSSSGVAEKSVSVPP